MSGESVPGKSRDTVKACLFGVTRCSASVASARRLAAEGDDTAHHHHHHHHHRQRFQGMSRALLMDERTTPHVSHLPDRSLALRLRPFHLLPQVSSPRNLAANVI